MVEPGLSKPGSCTKSQYWRDADHFTLCSFWAIAYLQRVCCCVWSSWAVEPCMTACGVATNFSGTEGESVISQHNYTVNIISHISGKMTSGSSGVCTPMRASFANQAGHMSILLSYTCIMKSTNTHRRAPNPTEWLVQYFITKLSAKRFLMQIDLAPADVAWCQYKVFACRGKRAVQDIAAGIYCMHAQDVAHLDLKTPNILLNSEGRAKIADLGLGKLINKHETVATQSGTVIWMSPEHLLENRVSLKSDVWALSCIIWEVWSQ